MKSLYKLDALTARNLVMKRLCDLDYTNDLGGGSTSPTGFDLSSSGGYDVSAYATPVDTSNWSLDSQSWSSVADNPPLSSPLGSLGSTGGASMNTVAPNPQVYNSGNQGVVSDISNILGVASQWGSSITSLVSGPSQPQVYTVRTGATTGLSSMSSTTKVLLLVGIVVVLYLVFEK